MAGSAQSPMFTRRAAARPGPSGGPVTSPLGAATGVAAGTTEVVPLGGRRAWILLAAGIALAGGACASEGAVDGGATTTAPPTPGSGSAVPGTVVGGTTDWSVPVVDPASVEAFCALDRQLDELTAQQFAAVDVRDPEAFRRAMATFLDDNDAVLDQYAAAAPAEIEAEVQATADQTRAAVDDPALFADLLSGAGDATASNRVSAFIEANCPD